MNGWKNALREEERSDPRREISQRKRKLMERVLGWAKLDRPLRQIKLRGLKRVDWFYRLVITAYNLRRLQKLLLPQMQVAEGAVSPGAIYRLPQTLKRSKKPLGPP